MCAPEVLEGRQKQYSFQIFLLLIALSHVGLNLQVVVHPRLALILNPSSVLNYLFNLRNTPIQQVLLLFLIYRFKE